MGLSCSNFVVHAASITQASSTWLYNFIRVHYLLDLSVSKTEVSQEIVCVWGGKHKLKDEEMEDDVTMKRL